jgi:lipopolysaccharide export system protein LptC
MTDYSHQAAARPGRRSRFDPTRTRGEADFRAAQRHSQRVRWLKFVLPALAVAGVGLFWASSRFIPSDLATLISLAGIDPLTNSVVMDKPQISGFEGTRRAYEVKADRAVQALDNPKVVTFEQIAATIGMEDAGTATVDAELGVYDGNNDILTLSDGIAIKTTTGYWANFEAAAIDLRAGSLTSDQPIEIRTDQGTIRANGVEITDHGKRIAFLNGVSVTYLPVGELAAAPAGAAGVATTGDQESQ